MEIIIVNIYSPRKHLSKRYSKNMSLLATQLCQLKPKAEIIFCGDFNSTTNPIPVLHALSPQGPTFRRNHKNGSKESLTDWIISKNKLRFQNIKEFTTFSDHALLIADIEIASNGPKSLHKIRFNKKKSFQVCSKALTGC
jgi:endonuclease/exonuclease/phosphatase (EEP) superfamily protein YafD